MGKVYCNWVTRLAALVKKEILEEFRTRYAINSLLMFAVTSLVMVSFAVGVSTLSSALHASLLWIILFFASMSGVARAFVKEEEKNTSYALRLAATPSIVYLGKLLYNFIIMSALTLLVLLLYLFFLNPPLGNIPLLLLVVPLGVTCLVTAGTTIAAIVAKASSQGTLLPVLAFPVLLPLFITVIHATRITLDGRETAEIIQALLFLISYEVVILTASLLLFDYVWND